MNRSVLLAVCTAAFALGATGAAHAAVSEGPGDGVTSLVPTTLLPGDATSPLTGVLDTLTGVVPAGASYGGQGLVPAVPLR